MALTNKVEPQRAARNLSSWLARQLPGASDVRIDDIEIPTSSGLSTETVLFEASWRSAGTKQTQGMVARVQPDGPGVFPRYDLAKEARVMRALAEHTAVPAPKVLFHEQDSSILGAPFLVMERVQGRVPSDDPPFTAQGWVLDLTPGQRRTMWNNSLQVLADLHRVDWRDLGLGFLDDPQHGSGLAAQLDQWEFMFRWSAEGQHNPTIEAAFEWLRQSMPHDDGEKVLTWGDARVGNVIYSEDLSVAAALDWELVTLCSRDFELGWWLFLMRHHTEGIGLPLPAGIPDADETVAHYQELTGHRPKNLAYHEIFAGARAAICMVRAAHLMVAAGALPADTTMALNNPATQLVAKMLDLPAPTGDAISFIGNR